MRVVIVQLIKKACKFDTTIRNLERYITLYIREVFQRCRHRDRHMLANFYSRGRNTSHRDRVRDEGEEEDSGGGYDTSLPVVVEEEDSDQLVTVYNDLDQRGRRLRESRRVDYSAFY